MIKTSKTVYDPKEAQDGKRILVMSIWPRGIAKDKVDLWIKELGTDKDLIKKWKEQTITWEEFRSSYLKSLKGKDDLLRELAKVAKKQTVTLLCSCKDEKHCYRYLLKMQIDKLH